MLLKNDRLYSLATNIKKIFPDHAINNIIKNYNGEKCGDIYVKSVQNLKGINCPSSLNSSAIDEFLIIFLVACKAKGISYFKNLSELDQKESPRLKLGSKILNMMGIKTKLTKRLKLVESFIFDI